MENETLSKGEATQVRIVEVAYQLFLRQGYHGTSMRQIAEHADITMGGIYNHFAGKEAIWKAVLVAKHPYRQMLPLLREASGDTVAAAVEDAANRLVAELGRRTDLLNLMFIELVEFHGKHIPELFALVQPELLRLRDSFVQRRGNVRPISLPILARAFTGLFLSYYVTNLLLPEDVQDQMGPDVLHRFVEIYLYGILDEPIGSADG